MAVRRALIDRPAAADVVGAHFQRGHEVIGTHDADEEHVHLGIARMDEERSGLACTKDTTALVRLSGIALEHPAAFSADGGHEDDVVFVPRGVEEHEAVTGHAVHAGDEVGLRQEGVEGPVIAHDDPVSHEVGRQGGLGVPWAGCVDVEGCRRAGRLIELEAVAFVVAFGDFDEGGHSAGEHAVDGDDAGGGGHVDRGAADAVDHPAEELLLEVGHRERLALHGEGAAGPAKDLAESGAVGAVQGHPQADEAMVGATKHRVEGEVTEEHLFRAIGVRHDDRGEGRGRPAAGRLAELGENLEGVGDVLLATAGAADEEGLHLAVVGIGSRVEAGAEPWLGLHACGRILAEGVFEQVVVGVGVGILRGLVLAVETVDCLPVAERGGFGTHEPEVDGQVGVAIVGIVLISAQAVLAGGIDGLGTGCEGEDTGADARGG